jgi:hypothetical protein
MRCDYEEVVSFTVVLSLVGCTTEPPDFSLASQAFLCEKYQSWIHNNRMAKPYADELRRRGQDCNDYEDRADVEIEVK